MTHPAGWHPDPVPTTPGRPAQLRWWDGSRWTEHVAPTQPQAPRPAQWPVESPGAPSSFGTPYTGPPTQPAPYGGSYGATAPIYGSPYVDTPSRSTTPDGVPLAGWWLRVVALVVDTVLVGIVTALLTLPWLREVVTVYQDWFDEILRTAEAGTQTDIDTAGLQRDLARPLAVITLVGLALGFAYHVGFLMWRQATPGKMLVGLRVRLRDRPGPMPFGTVLVRWLAHFGVGIVGLVPLVGALTSIYTLLDVLWPLWDGKRQAIHDKAARTNVVRTR